MALANGVADLRVLLSDGDTDKLAAQKQLFGVQTSTNLLFKTMEFRRVTDFSSTATVSPLGVFVNGTILGPTSITADDVATGYVTIAVALTNSDIITGTYYYRWYTDDEITGFLQRASLWVGQDTDFSLTPDGLVGAVLKYAAHEAYQKLSLKMAIAQSDTYRLQDVPDDKRFSVVDAYRRLAESLLKEAYQSRDDYYSRKGKSLAPLFGTVKGHVRNVVPES